MNLLTQFDTYINPVRINTGRAVPEIMKTVYYNRYVSDMLESHLESKDHKVLFSHKYYGI